VELVGLVQCVTCNMCGCGSLLDFIFSAAACAWWAAASLVFGKYATEANKAELPEAEWRGWIIIVAWVQAGLFVIIAGISLIRCESISGFNHSTLFGCFKGGGLTCSQMHQGRGLLVSMWSGTNSISVTCGTLRIMNLLFER
jgi:hypothetical protein